MKVQYCAIIRKAIKHNLFIFQQTGNIYFTEHYPEDVSV